MTSCLVRPKRPPVNRGDSRRPRQASMDLVFTGLSGAQPGKKYWILLLDIPINLMYSENRASLDVRWSEY